MIMCVRFSSLCRILFEESKRRNEAVFDKIRNVKRIHKDISENLDVSMCGIANTVLF